MMHSHSHHKSVNSRLFCNCEEGGAGTSPWVRNRWYKALRKGKLSKSKKKVLRWKLWKSFRVVNSEESCHKLSGKKSVLGSSVELFESKLSASARVFVPSKDNMLVFAQFNIRTLAIRSTYSAVVKSLGKDKLSFLCMDMTAVGCDGVGMQEVRREGVGSLVLDKFTFFWSGSQNKRKSHGVGFLFVTSIASNVEFIGISERLLLVMGCFKGLDMAIFVMYFPTLDSDVEIKIALLEQISQRMDSLPVRYKGNILVLTDGNAHIGPFHKSHADFRGPWGVIDEEAMNENGELLLQFCSDYKLSIGNTMFEKTEYATWFHPNAQLKKSHILDFCLVSTSLKPFITDCGVNEKMEFDSVNSDHRPVFLSLKAPESYSPPVVPSRCTKSRRKPTLRLDFSVLKKNRAYRWMLSYEIERQMSQGGLSYGYDDFNGILLNACRKVLPVKEKSRHADWLIANFDLIDELTSNRRKAKENWLNNGKLDSLKCIYLEAKAACQRGIRRLKIKSFEAKTEVAAQDLKRNDTKSFCNFVKNFVSEPPVMIPDRLLLKDKVHLTSSMEEREERIREHFCELYNQPPAVTTISEEYLPEQSGIRWELQDPFTMDEVMRAANSMKDDKGLGVDHLAIEILKFSESSSIACWFLNLANECLRSGVVPSMWKDVIISPIFKKGDRHSMDNYRGISLISHYSKLIEKMLHFRIYPVAEKFNWFHESQNGFREKRSTVHGIFISRLVTSHVLEKNCAVYKFYADFVKAYDKTVQELEWIILARRGLPPKLVQLIKAFHEGSTAQVRVDGKLLAPFDLKRGLKQGSIYSPVGFNIYFGSLMEIFAKRVVGLGLKLIFKQGGNIFNLSNMNSDQILDISDNLFADDGQFLADSPEDLQKIIDVFAEVATAYGMEISLTKSVVLIASKTGTVTASFTIDGKAISNVSEMTYLGSVENCNGNMSGEVAHRAKKASYAFTSRKASIFNNPGLLYSSRLIYYKVMVLPVLLYASETWVLTASQLAVLESRQRRFLKSIFGLWHFVHKVSYCDVLLLASRYGIEILPIDIVIMKRRLIFLGEVERAGPRSICYQALHSVAVNGVRERGSFLSYRRSIKSDLKIVGIEPENWQKLASDEKSWRSTIDKGVDFYLRRWLLFKKSNTLYGHDEISERGRKVKELSVEMLNSKRIFVDTRSRSERRSIESLDMSFHEYD